MKRSIKLNYKREYFEEIYFVNNNAHYWKSPSLGRTPQIIIVSGLLFIGVSVFIAFTTSQGKPTSTQFGILAVGFIIFILSINAYIRKRGVIRQWLKGIQLYLSDLEKVNRLEFVLTDESFTFTKDENQTVSKWEDFQTLEITKEYLLLKGEQSIFIPRKCLSAGDSKFCEEYMSEMIGKK